MISVTQLLAREGFVDIDAPWFTDEARDRGTATHLATQYHDEGCLDPDSIVDTIVHGRLVQYRRFIEEVKPTIEGIEVELKSERLGLIGHVDRVLHIDDEFGVLDIKPAPASWHGLQLAGYAMLVSECEGYLHPGTVAQWNLYLSPKTYKLARVKPLDAVKNRNVFRAALIVAQWKEANL